MHKLQVPLSAEAMRQMSAGDMIFISGTVVTARDEAHKFLVQGIQGKLSGKERDAFERVSDYLRGGVIYHCGPIVSGADGAHRVVSAGPTTSIREEMYTADVVRTLGVRIVLGKGGMGEKTRAALVENGAVYASATGGAAVYLADRITSVDAVFMKDVFGDTEAMWVLTVNDLPATVTMDARGGDLHAAVRAASEGVLGSMR